MNDQRYLGPFVMFVIACECTVQTIAPVESWSLHSPSLSSTVAPMETEANNTTSVTDKNSVPALSLSSPMDTEENVTRPVPAASGPERISFKPVCVLVFYILFEIISYI